MDYFQAKTDVEGARSRVPELTEYENPVYLGGPSLLSMFPRYMLVVIIMLVHMLFWWGATFDAPDGEGGLMSALGILHGLADLFGIVGFFGIMLAFTWVNHFLNFSTASKWYTISLLLISATPGLFFLEFLFTDGLVGALIAVFVERPSGFMPDWNDQFYLLFGLGYTGVMFLLTLLYQRAFTYVITDKHVYIKKEFLKVVDASCHTMQLSSIENLKVERNLIGRILGFGNLHIITASGIGMKEESVSVGASSVGDVGDAATDEKRNIVFRFLRFIAFMVRLQRSRTVVDTNPEDCFYGIREPVTVQKLVNEIRSKPEDSEEEPIETPPPVLSEPEVDLDDLE